MVLTTLFVGLLLAVIGPITVVEFIRRKCLRLGFTESGVEAIPPEPSVPFYTTYGWMEETKKPEPKTLQSEIELCSNAFQLELAALKAQLEIEKAKTKALQDRPLRKHNASDYYELLGFPSVPPVYLGTQSRTQRLRKAAKRGGTK